MLSKEEIEKIKNILYPLSIGDFITWFTTEGIIEVEMAVEELFEYVNQLETDKQKLIGYIEKKIGEYDETIIEIVLQNVLAVAKGEESK